MSDSKTSAPSMDLDVGYNTGDTSCSDTTAPPNSDMPPCLKLELVSIHRRLAELEHVVASKDGDRWQAATDAAIQGVVRVVGMCPVPFDIDRPNTFRATGFVVHVGPEIGIIATPRHVVGAGPFEGFCRFANNEEILSTIAPCWSTRLTKSSDGVGVDASLGLVVVSRHIIPHDFSSVYVIIAGSISENAKVVFRHPEHNFVLIRYDPTSSSAVFSGRMSEGELSQGDEVYFLGPGGSGHNRIVHEKTKITRISPMTLSYDTSTTPTYCAINVDCVEIGTALGKSCDTGVLVNRAGEVVALWLEYRGQRLEDGEEVRWFRGYSMKTVRSVIAQIQKGVPFDLRILGAQFWPKSKHDARNSGVSQTWVDKLESTTSASHQFLQVML
ncbi:hypothetical protein CONLIGDRAFT_646374 [Coniochaeta ligniaria NRRL 30616]|uniref:Trypsin-like serine protease n=1 Tax=Coniochaeta ligniaria NRRL 30616 TaxID=1408157 RepID=A0A1J7JER0_9PEZI|nr:hypothetical protein CONLIGDRAFT_646374 [Coniochaeta ligniaria NRRL 30616]